MKRLFAALLLLFTLTACQQTDIPYKSTISLETATIEIGETHTDFEGVNIIIKDAVWDDNNIKLAVDWSNETKHEVTYGNIYSIELEQKGEWVSRQKIDNLAFTLPAYILEAGEAQEKIYNLTDSFDITENGKYRLITDCSVYDKGKDSERRKCNLWAEFTVTRKTETSSEADLHTHQPAKAAQTVSDPISGYCGNTQTTVYFDDGKSHTFMYNESVTITDILANLDYDTKKLCKCLPEYTVDTEFGTGYGINLTQGYARCDKGQADLTQEQIDKIKEIVLWAKNKAE